MRELWLKSLEVEEYTFITVQIATGLGPDPSNKRIAPSFPRKICSLDFTNLIDSGSHAKTAKYGESASVAMAANKQEEEIYLDNQKIKIS